MSAETMLAFLKNCTPEGRLGFQVAVQCAPVLKGVKVSNLMTVKPGQWHQIRAWLRKSRIICVTLYADACREVVFLYRYDQMASLLKENEVRRFLAEYGYTTFDVAAVFRRLRARYQQYAGGGRGFPHELGVLLEYPVQDVKSFILNQGENCLAARYWKVYHNLRKAEQTFRLYDAAKEQALAEIVSGLALEKVAACKAPGAELMK